MARTRSTASIETELGKLQDELCRLHEKEETLKARQLELQKLKQEQEAKQIMEAYRKSGKSLEELLTFLDVCLIPVIVGFSVTFWKFTLSETKPHVYCAIHAQRSTFGRNQQYSTAPLSMNTVEYCYYP